MFYSIDRLATRYHESQLIIVIVAIDFWIAACRNYQLNIVRSETTIQRRSVWPMPLRNKGLEDRN
jgi:hypothetical protein